MSERKTIFLTGATGFLGSHLTGRLLSDSERVAAAAAEAEAQKGVRGKLRQARKALVGKKAPAKKGKRK